MSSDIVEPRRAPRAALRCRVELRHRLSTWVAHTEDLGPAGCQLVTERLVEPGREVRLSIACPALGREVSAAGRVVWQRREAPSRLGVVFDRASTERGWFEALLRADEAVARAARGTPERLRRGTRVHLGTPPRLVVDFSPTELELLRRVGPGATADALARSFGPELHERTRGALFSLLGRRFLVTDPALAVDVERWRAILPEGDGEELARAGTGAPEPGPRPLEAQRLYDEALSHLGAGRLGLAVDRLRDALRLAPADETISSTVQRIERWA
jgi:hypothetical protein